MTESKKYTVYTEVKREGQPTIRLKIGMAKKLDHGWLEVALDALPVSGVLYVALE